MAKSQVNQVIVHLALPGGEKDTGIGDYADHLAHYQSRIEGVVSVYATNDRPESSSCVDPMGGKPWHKKSATISLQEAQAANEKALDILEQKLSDQYQCPVLFHIHVAYPHTGSGVSSKWLASKQSFATIHEYKVASPSSTPLEVAQAKRKAEPTREIMRAVNGLVIANPNELEVALLQSKQEKQPIDPKKCQIAPIPPNIMPNEAQEKILAQQIRGGLQAWLDARHNFCAHFGMMREKKGIEDVILAQKLLQMQDPKYSKKPSTILGKVTPTYAGYYRDSVVKAVFTEDTLKNPKLAELLSEHGIPADVFSKQLTKGDTPETTQYTAHIVKAVRILESEYQLQNPLVNKQVNVTLVPDATNQEIIDHLLQSRIGIATMERGVTPHSGSVPVLIASKNIVMGIEGEQTPAELKAQGVILVGNSTSSSTEIASKIVASIQSLEHNPEQYWKHVTLAESIAIPTWNEVVKITVGQYQEFGLQKSPHAALEQPHTSTSPSPESPPVETQPSASAASLVQISQEFNAHDPAHLCDSVHVVDAPEQTGHLSPAASAHDPQITAGLPTPETPTSEEPSVALVVEEASQTPLSSDAPQTQTSNDSGKGK